MLMASRCTQRVHLYSFVMQGALVENVVQVVHKMNHPQRVLITEAAMEKTILRELKQLGVRGYTVLDARGQGSRGVGHVGAAHAGALCARLALRGGGRQVGGARAGAALGDAACDVVDGGVEWGLWGHLVDLGQASQTLTGVRC